MQSLFEEGFCKMAEMGKKEVDSKFYSRGIISVWQGFFLLMTLVVYLSFYFCSHLLYVLPFCLSE